MSARVRRWWLAAAALAALAACGKPAPKADTSGVTANAAAVKSAKVDTSKAAADTMAQPMATPVSAAAAGGTGPYAFRHEKHRALKCQRCHTNVPGHAMHSKIACTSCHARVPVTGPIPTSDQCAACHHAAAQPIACVACHDSASRGAPTVHVTWKFSVWAAPRTRDVHFDHNWHKSLQCTDCHTNRPQMVPTRACGSCHQHHDGQADCRTCHRSPPPGAHTVAAHDGCAASGCHQSPPVTVATLSRNECLLCHADRVNHEPGRACAQCHMLKSARGSGAAKEPEPR